MCIRVSSQYIGVHNSRLGLNLEPQALHSEAATQLAQHTTKSRFLKVVASDAWVARRAWAADLQMAARPCHPQEGIVGVWALAFMV